jgi:hypothetical protein
LLPDGAARQEQQEVESQPARKNHAEQQCGQDKSAARCDRQRCLDRLLVGRFRDAVMPTRYLRMMVDTSFGSVLLARVIV